MAKYYVEVTAYGTVWHNDPEMKIRHREGQPAVEDSYGGKYWYKEGKLHREDGPAIEHENGNKMWYLNGHVHREDGPAIANSSGYKAWYKDGGYHRDDGPAREFPNGRVEYWLNGDHLTKDQWEAATRPPEELTVAQIEQLLGKRIKVIK